MKYTFIILLFFLNLLPAQGTKADYERAHKHREKFSNKVFKANLNVNWEKNERFIWYKVNETPGKDKYYVVDLISGKRKFAFDADKLSKALSVFLKQKVSPSKLSLKAVNFNRTYDEMSFVFSAKPLKYNLKTYELKKFTGKFPVQKKLLKKPKPVKSKKVPKKHFTKGNWQAFIKNFNLYLRELPSKKEFQLSHDGTKNFPYSQILISPDFRKIICIQKKITSSRKVHIVESTPKDQLQPKLHTLNYPKPGDTLAYHRPKLFDVSTKKMIPLDEKLYENSWSNNRWQWSKDGSYFSFLHNQRGHQALRLIHINPEDGEVKAIINEESKTFIHYTEKNYIKTIEENNEIIWMSERDGWNHLYLIDSQSGKVKNQITKGLWPVKKVLSVDISKKQIWFTATGIHKEQDPYHIHFCRINFDGTGLTFLTQGDGTHELKYSPQKAYYIDTYSRVDMPKVHELRRSNDGSLVTLLEKAEHSQLLAAGWRAPIRFKSKGRDGKADIWGVIILPTNFDKSKKYPVIEQIYAGPHDSHVPKKFSHSLRTMQLAELGFITVQIDGMGTSNRSKAFHDVCWQNLSDGGFPDRILWMKAAAKSYPQMDLKRVGIYGGSAGGQNALSAVLNFGEFYKAAAADCGCHDNRMDKIWWNEQWMGAMGPHYKQQSNVTHAHKLKGKLLLTVGEMDTNVDPASTMQVVKALIKADKDFDLIVFPGGGHGSGWSKYGMRRLRDFFVRHLHGVEPRRE